MTVQGFLTVASTLLYIGGGLVGWLLCFAARKSRRFHPPISLTGTAIGVLPTYLVLLRGLKWAKVIPESVDIWQLLMLCLVCLTIVATGAAAYGYVLDSNRKERAEARMREQAGC